MGLVFSISGWLFFSLFKSISFPAIQNLGTSDLQTHSLKILVNFSLSLSLLATEVSHSDGM